MIRSYGEIGIGGLNLLGVSFVTCNLIQEAQKRTSANYSLLTAGTLALATTPVALHVFRKVAKVIFPAMVSNPALLNAVYVGLGSLGVILGMYSAYRYYVADGDEHRPNAYIILATTVIGAPITIELIAKVVQAYLKKNYI